MEKTNATKPTRGGQRKGSGRKIGTGKFQEPTTVMRIPVSQKATIVDFLETYSRKQAESSFKNDLDAITDFEYPALDRTPISLPLYHSKVPAGVPSPADDHVEKRLDPSEFLVEQQDSTFFVTISGYSMVDAGLLPGDKAVIDRSKLAQVGDIVLASVDGEFTVKLLTRAKDGSAVLSPANQSGQYKPIEVKKHICVEIWGVVTGSFRKYK